MNTAKWGLAEACRKMGRCQQAADLYEQVLEIQDTLRSRKARNTAQELAAVYHEKEQEQTIMQQEAENTRQRNVLISMIAVLLAVTVFAVIVIFHNRTISRKNRILVQQIAETVNYKKKYWNEKQTQSPTPSAVPDLNTASEEQLFKYIDEVIVREKLFLDPRFGCQTIMDRFQLSKERVGTIFSKGSEHDNMTSYVQLLRLECAANQLIEQPEKSFAQIATDCGFNSSTYFSSRFRQHFGMSPTEFRKEAMKGGSLEFRVYSL